jgi:hypothetical protein
MKKRSVSILLAGLMIAAAAAACLRAEAGAGDLAWKRLKKMRVRAGVMIGKGRPGFTEAYVRLTSIRAILEQAGIQEPVTVVLFADFGTKLLLGTYEPVITVGEDGGQAVSFPTIPNAFLVTKAFSYSVGDLYPFQFLDRDGKVRALVRIRLMGWVDQAF